MNKTAFKDSIHCSRLLTYVYYFCRRHYYYLNYINIIPDMIYNILSMLFLLQILLLLKKKFSFSLKKITNKY